MMMVVVWIHVRKDVEIRIGVKERTEIEVSV